MSDKPKKRPERFLWQEGDVIVLPRGVDPAHVGSPPIKPPPAPTKG